MDTVTSGGKQIPKDETAPAEKTKVFVSYSRRDREFVARLVDALTAENNLHVFRDTDDILPTEEWRQRLENLIGEADTIVFCLSPHSAKSEVCAWEVEYAESLNKRIAPIVIQDVDGEVPGRLAKLNYLFFTQRDDFDHSFAKLIAALDADIGWIREHTRIGELARRWLKSGRRKDQLVRGIELHDAANWKKFRPASAPLVDPSIVEFLEASRNWEFAVKRRIRLAQSAFVGLLLFIGLGWWQRERIEQLANWWLHVRPFVLSADAERELQPTDAFKECTWCPEMLVIPAGRFLMGSREGEGKDTERPQHEVHIAQPFAVSKFEVTFDQWDACVAQRACKELSDPGWERQNRPVINVSWRDTKDYLVWLSDVTGRRYRLLSEAEWEYAARAGSATEYHWGDGVGDGNANCDGCGSAWDRASPAPVGSFKPNSFGLFDMHGNVAEWVEDTVSGTARGYKGAPTDGSAWIDAESPGRSEVGNELVAMRVIRGGSFMGPAEWMRSASRSAYTSLNAFPGTGFRVARTLDRGQASSENRESQSGEATLEESIPVARRKAQEAQNEKSSNGSSLEGISVFVDDVEGAPQYDKNVLSSAMENALEKLGANVIGRSVETAFTIKANVSMGPATSEEQTIKIVWRIADHSDNQIGYISQENVVRRITLRNQWSSTADAAAVAAAKGISKLLNSTP